MTIDSVAPSERSLVRFATPYLEVETQSISSLERTIMREQARARSPRRGRSGRAAISLWGAFIRTGTALGSYRVLVDEAAEPVVSADRGGSLRREGSCWLIGFGGREAERAVRPMSVAMVDELAEDVL
jgi:hypothetical protein